MMPDNRIMFQSPSARQWLRPLLQQAEFMRTKIVLLAVVLHMALRSVLAEAPSGQKPREVNKFPEPLPDITCNITDLERTGYFTVAKVAYGRTAINNEEAMIWKVKVNKPLTCRHAILLLRSFRDVRFYDTAEGAKRELHSTLIYYSDRLSLGAVNRELLKEGDGFDVWILIGTQDVRRLKSLKADTVVFSELRHEPTGSP